VEQSPRRASRRVGLLRTLGLDIVGPLVAYQLLRNAGVSEVWSLVLSGVLPAFGVLTDWLRWRTLEVVGVVVLAGIGISVVLALVTHDPKVVLLEGAIVTAAFGLTCLGSLSRRRPLIFYFAQAFSGGRHSAEGAEMDADYDRYHQARAFWRIVTTVWGVTYVVEALIRVVVVQIASTSTALAINRIAPWIILGSLFTWTYWWGHRMRSRKPVDSEGS